MYLSVFLYIYSILGECLLIPSLLGKASRMLVESLNLISKDTSLVFYLSVYPLMTLQTSDYDVIIYFCVDSASLVT